MCVVLKLEKDPLVYLRYFLEQPQAASCLYLYSSTLPLLYNYHTYQLRTGIVSDLDIQLYKAIEATETNNGYSNTFCFNTYFSHCVDSRTAQHHPSICTRLSYTSCRTHGDLFRSLSLHCYIPTVPRLVSQHTPYSATAS